MRVNSDREQEQAEYSLARHTKLLCSAVFVVGRNPYEYIENDLRTLNHYHDWDSASVEINRDDQVVTISTDRGISKKATYNSSLGCTLLPEGQSNVNFEPTNVTSKLDDPTTMEWPMGSQNAVCHDPPDVDRKALLRTLDDITSRNPPQGMPTDTRAVVVLKDGKIVGESYASGFNKNTQHVSWSMGKSVTSALIGILIEEGHFKVDDPAPIDAWQDDARSQITINNLLRMSSGLEFRRSSDEKDTVPCVEEDHHYRVYCDPIDSFEFVSSRSVELEPGTEWRYRNCDTLNLGKIIRETVTDSNRNYLEFPQRALYDKIGVRNMVHEPDPYGNFLLSGYNYGTARDWARFGQLHLQEGKWNGERILPKNWIDYITTPAPAHPEDGYGGQFWLNRGKELKEVPTDAYFALGYQGQVTMIIPSLDVVIVRLGHTSNYDHAHTNVIVREIIDSIEV